jgi:hypothetical protein
LSPQNNLRRGKASPKTSRVKGRNQNGPPQIRSNIELTHRYRFISTSGTSTALTATSLLCAAGTVCYITNSSVVSTYSAVRVNSIEIWTPPASQGSTATCSVDWVGGFVNVVNREISDTSVSVTTPAHIVTGPPPMSLAKFWQTASTTTLCNVVAPTGSIIDVVLSLVVQDTDSAAAVSTVATAVLGQSYFLSLDSNATHRYTPVSLTTTF